MFTQMIDNFNRILNIKNYNFFLTYTHKGPISRRHDKKIFYQIFKE